jgi:FlaG/FlaF family flagellin (archaellin)
MRSFRPDVEAVSEVVGNLLILMITVALFGVVLGFIYSIPGPSPTLQAEIVPMLERTSSVDATLYLQHTGGEDLKQGEVYVIISINDVPTRFEISDGLGGKTVMQPGDVWTKSFVGTAPTSAKIDIRLVDTMANNLLFYTVVQRGVASGGNHDPIIAYAWVDTTSGSDIIPNNDYTTFRVYAVCKDLDGNLPPTGSVKVKLTSIDNGDGTFSVTAVGAGSTAMSDSKGDGVYLTGLLKVRNTVVPGDYSFTVTATDDTARSATATVKITVSTSNSMLRLEGEDVSPALLKAGDVNKMFLKLKFTAIGESIHLTQLRVTKLGTIADASVTVHVYWDKDADGVLDIVGPPADYDMPGFGAFAGGLKDFISTPLFTAIQDTPTLCWVVLSIGIGTEGKSVGVRIESTAAVISIGVSTPIKIPPIGSFPIDSATKTVKGVFKIYGDYQMPARVLTNTNHVKIMRLQFVATGETVYIEQFNITLFGTVGTNQVTVSLWDEYAVLLGTQTFDLGTRKAYFAPPLPGWKVDKAEVTYDVYVYVDILGAASNTLGLKVDSVTECYAKTEISLDHINPQAPLGEPIPNPIAWRTLESQGAVTIQNGVSTALPIRAGHVDAAQNWWLFRCYGEPIDFYSFNVTLLGTIPYDKVVNIRLIASGGYPAAIVYDKTLTFNSANWAKFQNAVPTNPIFTVSMDASFYGYVYIYSYISIAHGQEGKTIQTGLDAAAQIACKGQVTSTSITVTPYAAPDVFPVRGASRVINGQLYAHRTSLIPAPLVDSSQNIPVMKMTFKAEGQAVTVTAITIRKLGTVAQNLVTVRIYWDSMNDTINKLDGNDIELDIPHSGNFIANAITFTPMFVVTPGTDYNVVIAFSLNLGTAGWTLGASVSCAEMGTQTAAPNNANAYPNACLNAVRNPPLVMTTPTVNIADRGTLKISVEDLTPSHCHENNYYYWMKLTFWAEGETVNVNRIVINMQNVTTGSEPNRWDHMKVFLINDKNNNSAYEMSDDLFAQQWLDSTGETAFLAFPLFSVKTRTPFNLLITIYIGWDTVGRARMNITDASRVQCSGVVSGLAITPTVAAPPGPFPILSTERRIFS